MSEKLDIPALDIETAPTGDAPQEYALQPWRAREGTAMITNIAVGKASGEAFVVQKKTQYRALLRSLEGQTLTGYNLTFDISFLIGAGYVEEVKKIKWVDAMLIWKWLSNSQRKERRPAWSLADAVKYFFKDEPWAVAFVKMKEQEVHAGAQGKYWETRAKLDAIMTARVATVAYSRLTPQQQKSCMISMASLIPVAESYERGVMVDFSLIDDITPAITEEMATIEYKLGVHNHQQSKVVRLGVNGWIPSKILRSPKQMANLLYNVWKLTPKSFSEKTKAPSTDKAALTYLADDDDHVIEILRWRQLNTQLTKYIQSPLKSREYLGSEVLHPQARIFSTYTGRMTYTSKIKKKFPIGMALHQWPRQKEFRALIRPRPGYKHVEYDAAAQESRLIADYSGDENMTEIFVKGMDFHSFTGSEVSGIHYDDFMKGKKEGNTAITGDHGYRYQGKFTNLSCIAAGELVDTDRGPVPIQLVSILDKVWDGCEYVSHKGVKYMGYKDVILRDCLLGTPDHKVLTKTDTWKKLEDISNGEIKRRYAPVQRKALRRLACHKQQMGKAFISVVSDMSVQMWSNSRCLHEQLSAKEDVIMSQLFQIIWTQLQSDNRSIPRSKEQVRGSKKSGLPQLRWSWDNDEVQFSEDLVRLYISEFVSSVISEIRHRQDTEQWTLRGRQPQTGYPECKFSEQTHEPTCSVSQLNSDTQPSLAFTKDRLSRLLIFCNRSISKAARRVYSRAYYWDALYERNAESKAHVYDIINAGPRHRFTIQGRIVSNCNYRIGVKKLRVQARVQYGMNVDFMTAASWQNTFHRGFKQIKPYWTSAINKGKLTGYAESMAGRRYKLDFWDKESKWSTESSAINFPIQGSGADMADLAIQEIGKNFPDFELWFTLHDGIHYEVPEATSNQRLLACKEMLNAMDYKYWWGYKPTVPLVWDASAGARWSELKEL
jgi:DNA polymerase I-like protein with 3'-5' exonuclease and polymerase domains